MKRKAVFGSVLMLLIVVLLTAPLNLQAQEEEASSPFSVGGDLVSSYLWRGVKFGTGPAIQPYLELALGNFAIGGWGSYCFTSNEGAEADLYVSYGFDFGLSIGMTDYYFPGGPYFDYGGTDAQHAFEVNLGYEIGGLSITANMFLNQTDAVDADGDLIGAGTAGQDMYFELGYSFEHFGVFVGGGDGWHTSDGEFMVTNIGITSSYDLQITENFALPVTGSLILNPEMEQFHVVVGVSF